MVTGILGGLTGGAAVVIAIKAVDSFSGTFNKASSALGALKFAALGVVTAAGAAGVAMGAIGKASLETAADFQQTEIAFETMLGSAERAQSFLEEVREFAKETPFELNEVVVGAKRLMAMGVEAENTLEELKKLGDIAAGVGRDKLPQLILAFGQVRAAGKLTGQELRQFTEAGVPLLEELAKNFNLTAGEVQEMISSGEVGFKDVSEALANLTKEGGRFEDLMGKQMDTVEGKFSNIKDALFEIRLAIGKAMLPAVTELANVILEEVIPKIEPLVPLIGEFFKNAIEQTIPLIRNMIDWIKMAAAFYNEHIRPSVEGFIPVLGELWGALKVIIPPILDIITEFAKLQAQIQVYLWPLLQLLIKWFKFTFGPALEVVAWWVKGLIEPILALVDAVEKLFGIKAPSKRKFKLIDDDMGNAIRLNDFILRPDGQIIKTHPQDTIIGTKGGLPGNQITIHIENIYGTDPTEMAEALQRELNKKISLA